MKWLLELAEQSKAVDLNDGIPVPDEEVRDGERVVGVLSDDLKRLYVVWTRSLEEQLAVCEEKHAKMLQRAQSMSNSELVASGLAAEIKEHELLHGRLDLIKNIFWHEVKTAFPEVILEGGGVGLRKDWKVVVLDQSRSPLMGAIVLSI